MRLTFNAIGISITLHKLNFYVWLVIGIICLLFILTNRHYKNDKGIYSQIKAEKILNEQRLDIEEEMEDYRYDALSGRNIRGLSDLAIERGGNPIRSVIVSTWRSGSSFFGDLISAHPATYFFFEPLINLNQFRRLLPSQRPTNILRSLFACNFSDLGDYLEYRKSDIYGHDDHNRYLKELSRRNKNLCYDAKFSTEFCSLFPFQTMKIIYSDLALMDDILKDKRLGVRIVLLIRDPRGVMNSRKNLFWCQEDCNDSASLCSNMLSDYSTAVDFSKRYPHTFKVLRYEDLTSDPWKIGKDIFSFYGLDFHEDVQRFMRTHTNVSHVRDPHSTYKNSRAVTFQWRDKLPFDEVKEIQRNCRDAMNVWGYNLATDSHHQRTFNPVKSLSIANINHFV